jgi:ribose transport system permease protein
MTQTSQPVADGDARPGTDASSTMAEHDSPGETAPGRAGTITVRRGRLARRSIRGVRDYAGAFAALVVIFLVLSVTQDGFLTVGNLQNVLQTNAPLFLVSVGMTFVVISAGFDLSVGSMMAVAEGLLLLFINHAQLNPLLAVVLAVVCCGLIGAVTNGIAIGVFKLNFFVTTLGTMILLQGIVLVATNGTTQPIDSAWLAALGNNTVGIVPIPIIICAGLLALAWFLLRFTTFGRAVYCVGGNAEAARMSGISVPWNLVAVYSLSGLCGGIAGVVDAGRLASATPTAGSNIALTSAAAVLLGGASLMGGVGKLAGTTIGVLVLAMLGNGVDLFGLSAYWQDVVTGAVLLVAILFDRAHKSGLLVRQKQTGAVAGLPASQTTQGAVS